MIEIIAREDGTKRIDHTKLEGEEITRMTHLLGQTLKHLQQ